MIAVSTPTSASSSPVGDLIDDLWASPSPFHAVERAVALLGGAGFEEAALDEAWTAGAPVQGFVRRGGALVAWAVPDVVAERGRAGAAAPVRIIGAHTDSPNLRLKPRPDGGALGWRQWAVEVYGGALLNSWLDRDLGLSGRLVLRSGEVRLVRIDRPLARVAQLAIHLDRDVNERGLVLDKQAHLAPLVGLGDARPGEVAELVAQAAGVDGGVGAIAAFDLMLHDLTPPATLGVDDELLVGPRLDNQFSCFTALRALAASDPSAPPIDADRPIAMVCLFDHEEVGSESTTGAGGPLLEVVLERLVLARGGGRDELLRALAASTCLSADMAHAVHPNYGDRHEPGHRPRPNSGPVLKVNANQRYATDAATAASFTSACERAGVPWQVFVGRSNLPCGSTIGPITAARLGIATVDVGCAMLSMHSARELAGAFDVAMMTSAMAEFLAR